MWKQIKDLKKQGPFGIAGAVLGAISLYSLLQRLMKFGMSQIIEDFVGYYRQVADISLGWVPNLLSLPFPDFWTDFWAFSLVGAGTMGRAYSKRRELASPADKAAHDGTIKVWIGVLAMALSGFGILLFITGLSAITLSFTHRMGLTPSLRERGSHELEPFVVRQTSWTIFFLFAIFGLNAFAPSVS